MWEKRWGVSFNKNFIKREKFDRQEAKAKERQREAGGDKKSEQYKESVSMNSKKPIEPIDIIKEVAARRSGELLLEMEKSKPGPIKKDSLYDKNSLSEYRKALEENNISNLQSHRWQTIAKAPEKKLRIGGDTE